MCTKSLVKFQHERLHGEECMTTAALLVTAMPKMFHSVH